MKARFLALAALVLGLASCQQEFNDVAQLGGEVDYQLKVDAAELATRAGVGGVDDQNNHYDSAFGAIDYLQAGNGLDEYRVDWTEVDLRYSLEVYDWNEDEIYTDAVPVKDRMVKIVDAYEPVVFDLRLVPGRNYHFVVFADFVPNGASNDPNVTYQSTLGMRHHIGKNLGDISIKENEDAINDEIGDAYFATKKVEVKHQALNVDGIVLQRPYGKLRVIATDLAELNLNVEPKSVLVKYTANRPVHFNAVTGAVETDATFKEVYTSVYNDGVRKLIDNNTIGLANHFYNAGYDSGSEAYSTVNADGVKRHTHMTLFTDYILAIDEQTTVQFEMTVSDANKEIKKTIFNTEIPVQRNYLTTIVGNVLTSATEITVTIDDNFANANNTTDTPFYQVVATDGYELVKAVMEGYKVILDGGVDENGNKRPITVTVKDFEKYFAELTTRAAQTTYTFPNGTEIDLNGYTLIIENNSDQPLIVVEGNNTLNIIDTSKEGTGAIVAEGTGVAILNNGTMNVEGVALGANDNGTVIENNGEANIVDSTLNNGALTNNEEGEANIADSNLNEGSVENNGMTNVNGGKVHDDAIENGDNATVGSYIKNADGLQAEINAAGTNGANNVLTLDADIVGNVTILQKEGVNLVIDGKGHKFDGVITVNGGARANGAETLKIMGINFETEKSDITFISAPSKIDGKYNYSHNVTIEGCTFKGNHTVGCASFTGTYNFKMDNCTADNVHSIAQLQSVDNTATIESVTVRNSKNGLSFGNTANATLKGSTIIAENYGVRGDGNASRGNLVIENTTIVAATPVVIRKVTTDGYNVELKNPEKLTKNGGFYHVVFTSGDDGAAYAAPAKNYSITGANDLVVFPYTWKVSNGDELVAALDYENSKTKTVIFKNDIEMSANQSNAYGKTGINIKNGQTLDGAGHTFKVKNAGGTWDTAISTTGGTIKNLTVAQGFRGIFVNHNSTHSEKVILNNVVINGPTYTLNCDQGTYQGLEATNCTFNGWTSFAETIGEIKFNNCSFGMGAGYKTCVPYRPTTFTNCEFCANFDMYNGEYATLINCTSNGVVLTPANAYSGFADAKFMNAEGKESVLVSNNEQFAAAVAKENVETIYLSSGKHTIELYTNAVPRESLTIIGTEGTQVAFGNQQVRMALFRNFTIENCEILHMATKSWGMLVFGGGNKADGVYTVKNCTFNGVGTQGIYINEDVSGATYNVLGCTFNGDFTCNDGAITIQNNAGVNSTVNVEDCKFENFLGTKIFVLYNNDDMTLNNPDNVEVACGNR